MNFRKVIPLFIVLIFIFVLSGCFFLPQEDEYLPPPLRAPDRIEYSTIEVTRGDIADEIRGSGTAEARSAESVTFGNAPGRLKILHFLLNQEVEEGELLAELQNEELLDALSRQEIYTRLAEIDFERNRRGSRLDREAAQLRLDLSRLDLEKARAAVEKTRLYAPISGRIVYRVNLKTDEYVEAFLPIYGIADFSEINLRISNDFANRVPLGSTVKFFVSNETHFGTVVQVPSLNPADAADKHIAVIECDTLGEEVLRIGTSFVIIYERASVENAIVIQSSLIRYDLGRTYVILLENDTPVERNVVVGISTGAYSEIISGLEEGELIIH